MSQPPKSTMRAPSPTCRSYRGVRLPKIFSRCAPLDAPKKRRRGDGDWPRFFKKCRTSLANSPLSELAGEVRHFLKNRGQSPLPAAPLSLDLRDRADVARLPHPFGGWPASSRNEPSLSRARLQTLPFFCLSVSGR